MNVSRGLFRAWILVSVLWAVGAGSIAYITWLPDKVSGAFQPSGALKDGLKPWQVDYSKPFYDVMRSPATEKLTVAFFPVAPRDRADWDKDNTMVVVEMPDGSHLYMHAGYTKEDLAYIAGQFWDQRWTRWLSLVGVIVMWVIGPSLLLLIFGYSFLWVGRGFKAA
jgi:hypothetical protein